MTVFKNTCLGLCACLLLSGCGIGSLFESDKDAPLKGERISVLELQKELEPDDAALESQGLIMPEAWTNEFWPQVGGYPNHSMQNLSLNQGALKQVWKADIGKGASNEIPLITQPVIVDGRIFTLDTDNHVTAFDITNGKEIWRKDVGVDDEDDSVIAGGIATSGGFLYITNGFNEVLALKPTDGGLIWRKTLPAPSRAAPTVIDDRVFITTLDSRLMALNANDGSVIWEYTGISDEASLVGAPSAAANQDIVVPAFSSGEITALRVENGSIAWSDNLSNVRGFGGISAITDIRALPVIDKGMIIAISFSGRLVAIDERTGSRVWQRQISGSQTPWVAGNHVFILSSDNRLIALGRDNGSIRWITQLPRFDDGDPILFSGPVLAGGRLILAGSEGRVVEVQPENGTVIREWEAEGTVSIPPIVANNTLFLLDRDGKLSAYR